MPPSLHTPSSQKRNLQRNNDDVRSQSEYAEDRMPGAINLPVLDDAERAQWERYTNKSAPSLAKPALP